MSLSEPSPQKSLWRMMKHGTEQELREFFGDDDEDHGFSSDGEQAPDEDQPVPVSEQATDSEKQQPVAGKRELDDSSGSVAEINKKACVQDRA